MFFYLLSNIFNCFVLIAIFLFLYISAFLLREGFLLTKELQLLMHNTRKIYDSYRQSFRRAKQRESVKLFYTGNGNASFQKVTNAMGTPLTTRIPFKGITKTLTKRVYKNYYGLPGDGPTYYYDYLKARRERTGLSATSKRPPPGCRERHGKEHGKAVHEQLETLVNYNIETGRTLRQLPNEDRCARDIYNTLLEKGFLFLATELVVHVPSTNPRNIRYATAIDLVVFDTRDNTIVFIELKTGFEDSIFAPHISDPMMGKPFQSLRLAPKSMAEVQLLIGVYMFKQFHTLKRANIRGMILHYRRRDRVLNLFPIENEYKKMSFVRKIETFLSSS